MRHPRTFFRSVLITLAVYSHSFGPAFSQESGLGPVTRLPLPRFASLKSDRVNLREGPSKDHRTRWVYRRAGLPVEILAEFEIWRRIRDQDGVEGWVLHSLLSGKRTAVIAKSRTSPFTPLYFEASEAAPVVARLEPGVIVRIKSCDSTWCRVESGGYEGFVGQNRLWGVYPPEKIKN